METQVLIKVMVALGLMISHHTLSLFTQSFFLHRYAAHGMFTISRSAEKFFFVISWLFQGPSYLSPYVYGILHRLHHAHTDTEKDPHSPIYDLSIWAMMWKTKRIYDDIESGVYTVEEQYKKNVPRWESFDRFGCATITRIACGILYVAVYYLLDMPGYVYPLLLIHFIMGPIHGAIINWFAHKVGYRNYQLADTSTNIIRYDVFMWGECLHNNHHARSKNPNFAHKSNEFDPMYPVIKLFANMGIIQLVK